MEEQSMIKRAVNHEPTVLAAEETAHHLIRNSISKAMDLAHIFKKNSKDSKNRVVGSELSPVKAITEKDDNSSDIRQADEEESSSSAS